MKNLLRSPFLIVVCAFGLAFMFFATAALVARIAYGGSEEAFWGATLWSVGFGAVTITLGSVYALSVAADIRRERQKSKQPPASTPGSET